MATVEMGSKIPAAGPVMGPDNSKLVEPFAEKGALQRLPAVERAFKEARAAIEAAEVQPFIPEEKHRLHVEARDRAFETSEREIAKVAKTGLADLAQEEGKIVASARHDSFVRATGVAPSVTDEHPAGSSRDAARC